MPSTNASGGGGGEGGGGGSDGARGAHDDDGGWAVDAGGLRRQQWCGACCRACAAPTPLGQDRRQAAPMPTSAYTSSNDASGYTSTGSDDASASAYTSSNDASGYTIIDDAYA